ncbi:LPXTG cell wall anchor domain-containing protein [Spirilliplanes yamanashiensis]|uniref:LPXTG cell wall anchor domain-containing protein n=1 Tax=Spirilliplanes yamanashiensis TaxID=42233 RepID=A0A8J3YD76_9ACTN|nr:LPXTG cell wall anchor domain-containing protein [Spirilliplanes yamanashiensis]MDP9819104.1 LPXTG-motif cell wall-anchored protein [Spirilliplanes yamanashiensis]GIJ05558.1 hypothetical protein Sya03_49100 [Spirilliplanes yamanashiensis]
MHRPTRQSAAGSHRRRPRRLLAAVAAAGVFAALIGVTQISSAEDSPGAQQQRTPVKRNGLDVLADSCEGTRLAAHDGFQNGDRCVSTEFGEVGAAENNPTLIIADAPKSVRAGQPFRLKISTRNLVRDRFLAAGKGGYYVESSLLTDDGLVRGHFHTACRMLQSTRVAADPAPAPAFFVATEDGSGGRTPDTVTIEVPGLPDTGIAQCAAWAGDGSHRVPMMQRANQTPALDAVRIKVRAADRPPAQEEPDRPDTPQPGQPQPGQPQPGQPQPGEPDPQQPRPGKPQPGKPQPGQPGEPDQPGQPGQPDQPGEPAEPAKPARPVKTAKPAVPNAAPVSAAPTAAPATTPTRAPKPARSTAAPAQEPEAAAAEPTRAPKKAKPRASATEEAEAAADAGDGGGEPAAQPVAAPAPVAEGALAKTGVNTVPGIALGAILLLSGAVLFASMRRRRP